MIGADLNFSEEFVNSIFEKIKCIKKASVKRLTHFFMRYYKLFKNLFYILLHLRA